MSNGSPHTLDRLLDQAFQQTLDTLRRTEMVDAILARIRRRQRLRLLVLSCLGSLAAAVGMVNGVALLGLLADAMGGFQPALWLPDPLLAALMGFVLLGGLWLAAEEAI